MNPIPRGILATFMALLALSLPAAFAGEDAGGDMGGFGALMGQDLALDGGILDFIEEKGAVVVRNYATLTVQGRKIRARNLIFYRDTRRIYAEGDVTLQDPSGSFVRCDKLFIDITNWHGRAENVHIRGRRPGMKTPSPLRTSVTDVRPGASRNRGVFEGLQGTEMPNQMNAHVVDLRVLSRDHLVGRHVMVTPSNFARPHWHIASRDVNFRRDEKVESWHNVVKIGRVPIFYFPYIIKDLRYEWPWVRVRGGESSDWGFYSQWTWGFDLNPKAQNWLRLEKLFIDTDWYQKRGYPLGAELTYRTGHKGSKGKIDGFWVYETTSKDDDEDRAHDDVHFPGKIYGSHKGYEEALYRHEHRGTVEWWHRQIFNDKFDLRLQAHWMSDRDFYEEYFPNQWREDGEKNTNASLRWISENWKTELVAQKRLHDWESKTEYLPEWRFNLPGLRLVNKPWLPLYVRSDVRAGLLKRRSDKMLNYHHLDILEPHHHRVRRDGTSPEVLRLHQETAAYVPIKAGPWTLQPYGGYRTTFYSDTYKGGYKNDDDPDLNHALIWGADLSSRFYGFYKEKKRRHVVEPVVRFIAQERPSIQPEHLYDFDEVDNFHKSRLLLFELNQRIQDKRPDRLGRLRKVDMLTLDLRMGYQFVESEADRVNGGDQFTDIEIDMAWRPTDNLTFFAGGAFDPYDGEFNTARGGGDWRFMRRFRVYANTYYRRGQENSLGNKTPDSLVTSAAVRTMLWNEHSNYQLEYAVSYEHMGSDDGVRGADGVVRGGIDSGVKEQSIALIRDLDTFELEVRFSIDHDNDYSVWVNLVPKGWVGIDRGDSIDTPAVREAEGGRYNRPTLVTEEEEIPEIEREIDEDYRQRVIESQELDMETGPPRPLFGN